MFETENVFVVFLKNVIALNMVLMSVFQLGNHRSLILLIVVLENLFLLAVEANIERGKGKR